VTPNHAVVLTTFSDECRAVLDLLDEPPPGLARRREERQTLYETGVLAGDHSTWLVRVAETGPGNTTAAVAVERAQAVFRPDAILLVGVAGGLRDVALGDVVVADSVYEYGLGKDTDDGYRPRMRTHRPSERLLQHARAVARNRQWHQRVRSLTQARAWVKPVAAGDTLVAGTSSATASFLHRECGDAAAVEMEGSGFLHAVNLNRSVEALVVRGMSDRLTGKDPASDRSWQPVAARNAAAFAVAVLDAAGRPGPRPYCVGRARTMTSSVVSGLGG
jgi:nucleoside phosphorylase